MRVNIDVMQQGPRLKQVGNEYFTSDNYLHDNLPRLYGGHCTHLQM
jgi:hypothetical protein